MFNAIDAMPDGGRLELSGRYDRGGRQAVITVRDSGVGIPREHLDHVFEPFFTTKDEGYGVGLGLSTLYGIIQRHNASVTVDIHNIAGRRIRTLAAGLPVAADAPTTLAWDGKSGGGTAAPAGRYIVKISAAAEDGQAASGVQSLTIRR